MPYCVVAPYGVRGGAGGALRTAPVGGALRIRRPWGARYAYGARRGALRRPRGRLTASEGVSYAYGARGGAAGGGMQNFISI